VAADVPRRPAWTLALFLGLAACAPRVGSIGAVLGRDNDTSALYVRDVASGLAAEKAGLVPGDEIVMIDGLYVRDLPIKDVKRLLRGEVGSVVDLTIVRGREVRRVRVARSAFREAEVKPREERLVP
jgi:C-terminal processing protease CtpA/Prc